MVWNKDFPTDATKLRLAPNGIKGNWAAIETGGVPYDKLQLEKQVANPTRQNSTGWIFGKDPGTGFTELYYEDDRNPALITQLTNNGGIGALTQDIYCSAVVASGTYRNTQAAFASGWAVVNGTTGTAYDSYRVTSAKNGTGDYTITITLALSSANYVINGNVFFSGTRARVLYVYAQTANSFSVRTQAINASAGDYEDADFYVAIFGGR